MNTIFVLFPQDIVIYAEKKHTGMNPNVFHAIVHLNSKEVNLNLKQWYEGFLAAKTDAMSKDMTTCFMTMTMAEMAGNGDEMVDKFKDEFIYKVVDKRADFIGLDITPLTKMFLCFLVNGVPGTAVMYLTILKYDQLQRGGEMNMKKLSHIFPMGFLTAEEIERVWKEQKIERESGRTDNFLDTIDWHQEAIESGAVAATLVPR